MPSRLSNRILLKCPRIPESPYQTPLRTGFGPNSKDTAYPYGVRSGYGVSEKGHTVSRPYPVGYAVARPAGYGRARNKQNRTIFFIKCGFSLLFSHPFHLCFICEVRRRASVSKEQVCSFEEIRASGKCIVPLYFAFSLLLVFACAYVLYI